MDESKLAKIEALLRKAESTKFEAEAETYYAKASELMAKWSIDAAMLRSGKQDRGKAIHKTMTINKSGLWKSNLVLITCLARPNDVQILITTPRGKGEKPVVHMIGFEEDIANLEMLYLSMLLQNTRMRRQMMPKEYTTQADKVPWIRSFIEGFARRIEGRLMEVKKLAETAAAAQYGEASLLPVLASKEAIVRSEMVRLFPATKPMRSSRSRHDYGGEMAGRSAADRADIGNKRVGGNGPALNK